MVDYEVRQENFQDNIVGSVPVYLNTDELPPDVRDGMVSYYHEKLDNPNDHIHFNNVHRLAFYKTIEHTIFAIFLYEVNTDKFLVNEGYYSNHIPALLKNYLHHLIENGKSKLFEVYVEENLYELEIRLTIFDSRKFVFGVLTGDVQKQIQAVDYLEKLLYRYYLRKNDLVKELCQFDCIPEINKRISDLAHSAKENSKSFHLIMVEIEPLKKYIHVAGDYLVNEIIKNVQMEIKNLVGSADHCYILNSRQYLVCVTGIEESIIKEKFKHAHFRIKNLLLVYRMKFFEITDLNTDCNLYEIWSGLMIK